VGTQHASVRDQKAAQNFPGIQVADEPPDESRAFGRGIGIFVRLRKNEDGRNTADLLLNRDSCAVRGQMWVLEPWTRF
jgi:hypothetical protein